MAGRKTNGGTVRLSSILFIVSCGGHKTTGSTINDSSQFDKECRGEFNLDLSADTFEANSFVGGTSHSFAYEHELSNEQHYVRCLADWGCKISEVPVGYPFEERVCMDTAHCCDLGVVDPDHYRDILLQQGVSPEYLESLRKKLQETSE